MDDERVVVGPSLAPRRRAGRPPGRGRWRRGRRRSRSGRRPARPRRRAAAARRRAAGVAGEEHGGRAESTRVRAECRSAAGVPAHGGGEMTRTARFARAGDPRRRGRRFHRLPAGDRLFSWALGRMVPYSGSIGAVVRELAPGRARVELRRPAEGEEPPLLDPRGRADEPRRALDRPRPQHRPPGRRARDPDAPDDRLREEGARHAHLGVRDRAAEDERAARGRRRGRDPRRRRATSSREGRWRAGSSAPAEAR